MKRLRRTSADTNHRTLSSIRKNPAPRVSHEPSPPNPHIAAARSFPTPHELELAKAQAAKYLTNTTK